MSDLHPKKIQNFVYKISLLRLYNIGEYKHII